MPRLRLALAAALLASALGPGSAGAAVRPTFVQVVSHLPARLDQQVGFIPIQLPTIEAGATGTPASAGGRRFRLLWTNATLGGASTSTALRVIRRDLRYQPQQAMVFADRRLTAVERRTFTVLADVARDADVLVVARGHPACGGLTHAQARGIATGTVSRWSQLFPGVADQPDPIVRHAVWSGRERLVEPRLGLGIRAPGGVRLDADGGVRAAASGDRSAAAITSWSRARAFGTTVCAVAIDGVAPSDATVRGLSYREAYPITLVAARRRPPDLLSRAASRAFIGLMTSPAAATAFARGGLLTITPPGR